MQKIILRIKWWGYATALTLLIYSTLSIVRPISSYLRKTIPNVDLVGNISLILFVGLAILTAYIYIRKGRLNRLSTLCLLLIVLSIYAAIIWNIKLAEEKIHFFEYALLSFLCYRAFRIDMNRITAYLLSLILVILLGWGDELIQHLLPERYYDIRDVVMNGGGGLLGLLLTFVIEMDKAPLKLKLKREV